MLWLGLIWVWRQLAVFFSLPPLPSRRIMANAPCPACGAAEGDLLCVQPPARPNTAIMHTCKICHGRWFEATVVDDKNGSLIHPAQEL